MEGERAQLVVVPPADVAPDEKPEQHLALCRIRVSDPDLERESEAHGDIESMKKRTSTSHYGRIRVSDSDSVTRHEPAPRTTAESVAGTWHAGYLAGGYTLVRKILHIYII